MSNRSGNAPHLRADRSAHRSGPAQGIDKNPLREYIKRTFETIDADAETIAERLARVLSEPVRYREVEPGGARRAAERIAELL